MPGQVSAGDSPGRDGRAIYSCGDVQCAADIVYDCSMAASAKLEILVGPAGSGKSRAALDEYRRVLNGHSLGPRRRGLWLAPTQAAANAIRDAVAGALLDPGVRTFARFAGEVVWDAGLRV